MVGLLTLAGSLALLITTVKFYWGARGTPPLTGEARRIAREEEMRRRATQIEYSQKNPWDKRSPDFWDNRKTGSGAK